MLPFPTLCRLPTDSIRWRVSPLGVGFLSLSCRQPPQPAPSLDESGGLRGPVPPILLRRSRAQPSPVLLWKMISRLHQGTEQARYGEKKGNITVSQLLSSPE